MEKLQWFKFNPSDWVMGKIQRCPEITQARYIRLICLFWNKEGHLPYEDAEIEVDKEHLDILVSKKIIKIEDGFVIIDFMNEQLFEISKTSQKRKEAVAIRWNKLKNADTSAIQNDTSVLQSYSKVIQNDTEKRREEKSREEKIKSRVFKPPLVSEVIDYFIENGYKKEVAEKAFKYYDSAEWEDSKGNKVKNWKQKMNGNWFKDEYKITLSKADAKTYISNSGNKINKLAF